MKSCPGPINERNWMHNVAGISLGNLSHEAARGQQQLSSIVVY